MGVLNEQEKEVIANIAKTNDHPILMMINLCRNTYESINARF